MKQPNPHELKPHKNTRLSILTAAIGFPLFMMLFLPAQANSDWGIFLFYPVWTVSI